MGFSVFHVSPLRNWSAGVLKTGIVKTFEIITASEITEAFENTNFGSSDPRDVIFDTLRKVCTGYSTGRTATVIAIDLGLINLKATHITDKGFQYLKASIEESE